MFFGLLFIEVMIVLYSMHFNSILFKNETICTKWILSRYQNWTEIIKWYLLVQHKQNWHIFFILTQFKWDFDLLKWWMLLVNFNFLSQLLLTLLINDLIRFRHWIWMSREIGGWTILINLKWILCHFCADNVIDPKMPLAPLTLLQNGHNVGFDNHCLVQNPRILSSLWTIMSNKLLFARLLQTSWRHK